MFDLTTQEFWRVYFLDRDVQFGRFADADEQSLILAGQFVRNIAERLARPYNLPDGLPLGKPDFEDLTRSVLDRMRLLYRRRFRELKRDVVQEAKPTPTPQPELVEFTFPSL